MRHALPAIAAVLALLLVTASAGPLPYEPVRDIDLGAGLDYAEVADLDGDGVPDVATANVDAGGIVVHLNDGDATYTALERAAPEMRVHQMVAADLDGDGAAEIVATAAQPFTPDQVISIVEDDEMCVVLFANDGAGGLTATVLATRCDLSPPPRLTDLDGDGDIDIAYGRGRREPAGLGTLLNDGAQVFAAGPVIETRVDPEDHFSFGDLDGDGLPELVCERDFEDPAVFPNLGDGKFGFEEELSVLPLPGTILDITGDDLADVVTAEGTVYEGDGSRRITRQQREIYAKGLGGGTGWYRSFDLADLDGDDDLDLVTESYGDSISVFVNEGNGVFGRNHEYFVGEGLENIEEVAAGDFDRDGSVDVFVFGTGGARLVTPGGEIPPTIDTLEPTLVEAGARQVFTIDGAGLDDGTTVDFGAGNEIVELTRVSPECIAATVDVLAYAYDDPGERIEAEFDVKVMNTSGGSTRLVEAFEVEPYWDIGLEVQKGRLVDSPKSGRDRFKAKGRLESGAGHSFELFQQGGAALDLVVGSPLDPYEIVVPGDDPGWTVHGVPESVEGLTWRSPKGALPRIRIDLREGKGKKWDFRLSMKGFDFPGDQTRNVWIELYLGETRSAGGGAWRKAGKGRLRP